VEEAGCEVYVYFDNDQKSAAPADALKLGQFFECDGQGSGRRSLSRHLRWASSHRLNARGLVSEQ